ncbi:MAG: PilC/PilY family type IV pilus protein [Lautropia sp.]|nr:PilC/PilY family type IV pilus protein [Lautropia sp.]
MKRMKQQGDRWEDLAGLKRRRTGQAVSSALLMMSLGLVLGAAEAKIAQESLIVKDKPLVEPNLMFTLDDSGSMSYNFVPDNELAGHVFAYHPGEPKRYVYPVQGVLPTDDSTVIGKRRRSSAINKIYYNPEVRYRPWIDPASIGAVDQHGKQVYRHLPDANPKAAYVHWDYQAGGEEEATKDITVDLTGDQPKGHFRICSDKRPDKQYNDPCPELVGAKTVAPATYYTFELPENHPTGEPTEADKNNGKLYTRVSIKDHQSFERGPDRDECTPKGDGNYVCSQTQEYQNFANWYQYHRTRMHVAIAAVGQAFAELPATVRVGYGRINKNDVEPVDGVGSAVIERGVRLFQGNDRKAFFTWLNTRISSGATPLLEATRVVGKYFERRDDNGPWSKSPGTGDRTKHLSCRRSYHLLMTDGLYNETEKTLKDKSFMTLETDNVAGPVISKPNRKTTADGRTTWQYLPEAPYRSAKSGTLADFSMYFWNRDLRPDLDNDIEEDAENPAFWQHLSMYTMSFGIGGKLKPPRRDRDLDEDDPRRLGDWPALLDGTKKWPENFSENDIETVDDLWHAAVNARGDYLSVEDGTGFRDAMSRVLDNIQSREGNTAGLAVSSQTLETNNQMFVPSFRTGKAMGDLKAFALAKDGNQGALQWSAEDKMPSPDNRRIFVGRGGSQGGSVPFEWRALPSNLQLALLKAAGLDESSRLGTSLVDYLRGESIIEENGSQLAEKKEKKEKEKKKGQKDKKKDKDKNKGKKRDDDDDDDDDDKGNGKGKVNAKPQTQDIEKVFVNQGKGFRKRNSMLGHIVHSTPVYVGAAIDRGYQHLPAELPAGTASGAKAYRNYVRSKRAHGGRPAQVFVGSNDGILHAFDASTGVETYGYVPRAVALEMAALSKPGTKPRFMMDGPLVESDAWWDDSWHNVLVGTTGAGPRAVFALDVTDTRAATGLNAHAVMWEIDAQSHPELGHVLAAPEIGVMRDGTWVAIFGNGYESQSRRAQLFVVNLKTGRVITTIDTREGSAQKPNGLGGVRLIRDGNHVITGAYAGDLLGNLWKFDLASEKHGQWKVAFSGKPLFTTEGKRPITAAPATVSHPAGGTMVLVGTGKLFEEGDNTSTALDSVYGLWDKERMGRDTTDRPVWLAGGTTIGARAVRKRRVKHVIHDGKDFATIDEKDKANATLNWRTDRGWQIDLDMIRQRGQRNIVSPSLVSGLVLFETMSPVVDQHKQVELCGASVNAPAFNLLVDPLSGRMTKKSLIDTNRDGVADAKDKAVAGWAEDTWTGRSVVLGEEPDPPCVKGNCQQLVPPRKACPPGHLANSVLSVKQKTPVCVEMPGPTRWWWRELTIQDKNYGTGKAATQVQQPTTVQGAP